ncbi:hypothetical protein LXA43DRAFT_1102205 [Ganoderma leucocontextum]|nr:hypothetical protein LXA43DRAFT_1102205 [Ganoderma leucocontextum]
MFRDRLSVLTAILTKAHLRALPGLLLGLLWENNKAIADRNRQFDLDEVEIVTDGNHACFQRRNDVQSLSNCVLLEHGDVVRYPTAACENRWWLPNAAPGAFMPIVEYRICGSSPSPDVVHPALGDVPPERSPQPLLPGPGPLPRTARGEVDVPMELDWPYDTFPPVIPPATSSAPRTSQSRPTNAGIPLPTHHCSSVVLSGPMESGPWSPPASTSRQAPSAIGPAVPAVSASHHRSSVAPSGPMGSGPWSPPASTSQQASSAIGPAVPAASASRLPVAQKASPEKRKSSRSPSRTRGKGKKAKAAAILDDDMAAGFDHGLFQPTGPWTDDWLEHYHPCEGCRNGSQKCEVAPGKGTSCRACHAAKVGCSQTFPSAKALGWYRTWVFWKYCRNPTQYDDHRLATNNAKRLPAMRASLAPRYIPPAGRARSRSAAPAKQNRGRTGGKAEPDYEALPTSGGRHHNSPSPQAAPPSHREEPIRHIQPPPSTSLPDPGAMSELGGPGGALHGGEIGGADDGRPPAFLFGLTI